MAAAKHFKIGSLCIASSPSNGDAKAENFFRSFDPIAKKIDVCGGFLLIHMPVTAVKCKTSAVQDFMEKYNLQSVEFDSCYFGVKAPDGRYVRSPRRD